MQGLQLAKKIKSTLELSKTTDTLNRILFELVETYITETLHHPSGNLYLSFLRPIDGQFTPVGKAYCGPESKRQMSSTNIEVDDTRTMIGKLHSDSMVIYTGSSNTYESAEFGKFYFFSEDQKTSLKSIFIYKVVNETSREPVGYWCLESDQEGDLPSESNILEIRRLAGIFSGFDSRMQLEFLYGDALNATEYLFEEKEEKI
ncbi:hypothetical protein [Pseudophaeobacter sp. EL27]|uniref:hypothetical protein n=1 Tax=Pseudophaeobacter sp. EL27 TaxID=2107580 RepID=UPI0013C4FA2E|nr:hypothetical protein [Pseudophaeobacter sp. EL27]